MAHIDEEKRHWHIGKEIPVAVIIMLAVQTVAFIVWIAGLAKTVEHQQLAITKIEVTLKELSMSMSNPMVPINTANIVALEKKVVALEARLDFVQKIQAERTPFIPRRTQ